MAPNTQLSPNPALDQMINRAAQAFADESTTPTEIERSASPRDCTETSTGTSPKHLAGLEPLKTGRHSGSTIKERRSTKTTPPPKLKHYLPKLETEGLGGSKTGQDVELEDKGRKDSSSPSSPAIARPSTSPTSSLLWSSSPCHSASAPSSRAHNRHGSASNAPASLWGSKTDFAFAFDIDGVLIHSTTALPGASSTLAHLQGREIPFIFLTNSGGHHESVRVERLGALFGVPLGEDQFVQSHTPFRDLVPLYRRRNVLVIGGVGDACRLVAERYGFESVVTSADVIVAEPKFWPFNQVGREYYASFARGLPAPITPCEPGKSLKIEAILVFNSSRDWGLDCQLCLDLLLSDGGVLGTMSPLNGRADLDNNGWQQGGQPPIYFANPDFHWATDWEHGPRFGQGAWIKTLEAVFGEATGGTGSLLKNMIGKPYHATYSYGENVLIRKRETMLREAGECVKEAGPLRRVYMIGDNPLSDIRGANEYRSPHGSKWESILVATGVWKEGSEPAHKPTVAVANVKEAVNWALRREGYEEVA